MQRRSFTTEFKLMVVEKAKEIGNVSAVARQHDLNPNLVQRWMKDLNRPDVQDMSLQRKKQSQYVPTPEEYQKLERENEKLKKILGNHALEVEILRDLLKKTNPHLRIK